MPITDLSQLDLNKRYTYADYLTWRFRERVELLRGRIARMSPAPVFLMGLIPFSDPCFLTSWANGSAWSPATAPSSDCW